MPQELLPIFPAEATPISDLISFAKRDGRVYYFHGCMPVLSHEAEDKRSFRLFTSQLVDEGNCKQAEIVRAFGVSAISVKRWVKAYRAEGAAAFFKEGGKRKPRVLTDDVVARAQELLDAGCDRTTVAKELSLKRDTLVKAIRAGRLGEAKKKSKPGL